uniref:Ig-like domain-containing protein n=1 Tax=Mastacembelus armatus TaxID=205130 RepID=A0A7N8WSZ2_9TELE
YFICIILQQPCFGLKIISSSVSPTYAAVGDSVTLRCHFNLAPEDLGVLDIEWSIKPSDVREEETLVIWYDPFRGRVEFVSPDPASGNASISITDLTPTDHNTYQCKVRKLPGISMINICLNVMERPTEPECNLEGVVDLGHKVVLRCRSTQGSSPMWYSWYKESRNEMLPNDGYVNSVQGDLFLTVTKENILGTYICTAQNLVGMDTCRLTLKFSSAVRIRVAAAAAGTALITIIIIAIIIFCHHKRKIELHLGCEIIEDEMPPHKWLPKKSQQVIPSRSVLKVRKRTICMRYPSNLGRCLKRTICTTCSDPLTWLMVKDPAVAMC